MSATPGWVLRAARLARSAALAGAAALAGVGSPACGGGGGSARPVGSPCLVNADCAPGTADTFGACLAGPAWVGGYCTEVPCVNGSCAPPAKCVTSITLPGVITSNFCLAPCSASSDCRSGYQCVPSSDGVCVPIMHQ